MDYWQSFQRECHAIAAKSGFHDKDTSDIGSLEFSRRLLLIISEVVEAFEEHRSGRPVTLTYYPHKKPEGVPIELADVVIRVADLAETIGVDLGAAIEEKMAYNRTREYLHGKRF